MGTTRSPEPDKHMKNPFKSWKKPVIVLAIAAGGALTIAAGDNYFEVGKNLEIFNELYKDINIYYVDDVNPGELIGTGIDAMLESLDPYTQYIPESDMENYRIMTTGQYGGIGAMIRKKDDGVMVSEPYEGYPAMTNGIKAGDRILEVDGRSTKGMDTEEVSKLLKGQAGTKVKVLTSRDEQPPVDHVLTREEIKIPDVPYKGMIDPVNKVGYIKLNSFTQTAGQEVRSIQGTERGRCTETGAGPTRQRRWPAARGHQHREHLGAQGADRSGDQGQDRRMGQDL